MKLNKFNSLIQLLTYFRTEEVCREVITKSRWGDDVVCPYCGGHHCKKGYRGRFVCPYCKNKFSCLVGTIFENTKVSLRKWFTAMYLISSHKKGISSCQLARDIKVTQKTAWYMLQKIRTLYGQGEPRFAGDIELDEVYIGGKECFKHRSKHIEGTQGGSVKTKTPVFGMMMRGPKGGSRVCALVVPRVDRKSMYPIIAHICKLGSRLYTDEHPAYSTLPALGYDHKVIRHKIGQYVNGPNYTNNIEGFWTHMKRMIQGIYHKVSVPHLQAYINESVWRWNTRTWSEGHRFQDMFTNSTHRVTYSMVRS